MKYFLQPIAQGKEGYAKGDLCKRLNNSSVFQDEKTGTMTIAVKDYGSPNPDWQAQHLYLCSDEPITTGWYYNSIDKAVRKGDLRQTYHTAVIATTDPACNLPALQPSLIRAYADSNGRLEVEGVEVIVDFEIDESETHKITVPRLTPDNEIVVIVKGDRDVIQEVITMGLPTYEQVENDMVEQALSAFPEKDISHNNNSLEVKIEHFPHPKDCENCDEFGEWLASFPSIKGLAESGFTKEEAFEELMISLKVKLAYENKIQLLPPATISDEQIEQLQVKMVEKFYPSFSDDKFKKECPTLYQQHLTEMLPLAECAIAWYRSLSPVQKETEGDKWVGVETAMPAKYENVLLYTTATQDKKRIVAIGSYIIYEDVRVSGGYKKYWSVDSSCIDVSGNEYEVNTKLELDEVTHWQPLPTPPKAK